MNCQYERIDGYYVCKVCGHRAKHETKRNCRQRIARKNLPFEFPPRVRRDFISEFETKYKEMALKQTLKPWEEVKTNLELCKKCKHYRNYGCWEDIKCVCGGLAGKKLRRRLFIEGCDLWASLSSESQGTTGEQEPKKPIG